MDTGLLEPKSRSRSAGLLRSASVRVGRPSRVTVCHFCCRVSGIPLLARHLTHLFSAVYSFGITCYEICSNGVLPYITSTNNGVVELVLSRQYMEHLQLSAANSIPGIQAVIDACCAFDEDERPTMEQVMEMIEALSEQSAEGDEFKAAEDSDSDMEGYSFLGEQPTQPLTQTVTSNASPHEYATIFTPPDASSPSLSTRASMQAASVYGKPQSPAELT
jgi:serine/threonine protein kinase